MGAIKEKAGWLGAGLGDEEPTRPSMGSAPWTAPTGRNEVAGLELEGHIGSIKSVFFIKNVLQSRFAHIIYIYMSASN